MEIDPYVDLVIKCPSSNIDDFKIRCNLNWSVRRLKKLLSREFPTRPAVHKQKLMHMGNLLHSHMQLRDILRFDNEAAHVFCLHCPSPRSHNEQSSMACRNLPCLSASLESSEDSSTDSHDTSDNEQQVSHRTTFESVSSISSSVTMTPQEQPSRLITYDEIFANYYNYYVQSIQVFLQLHTASVVANAYHPPETTVDNEHPVITPRVAAPARNIQINNPENRRLENNADDGLQFLLDLFYFQCRCLVVLVIVYFYSTPERVFLVGCMAFALFIHQHRRFFAQGLSSGIMENRRNHSRQRPFEENPNENLTFGNDSTNSSGQRRGETEIQETMDGENPLHVRNQNVRRPTFWTFVWLFFASLFPD